ncbi:hypothetical protein ACKKBG_A13085 [Auxenochlorella protothecoides x Auxenochlorella symbiontica]
MLARPSLRLHHAVHAGSLRGSLGLTSLAAPGPCFHHHGISLEASASQPIPMAQSKLRLHAMSSSLAQNSVPASQPRQLPPHTSIPPPSLPPGIAAWESAVVLIDKPQGWTSFDVCAKLRFALSRTLDKKARTIKVGHAGTLDPMATGLLVVCVGRATKLVESLMAASKRYSGTMRLGEGTPSLDAETPVHETKPWQHVTEASLEAAAEAFLGEQEQIPPMYSAISVDGQRLYDSARKGLEVERKSRRITVHSLRLQRSAEDPQGVDFVVSCSKGTYVRSLAADLAAHMGTVAHLTALRRLSSGEHDVAAAWQLPDLISQLGDLKKEDAAQA